MIIIQNIKNIEGNVYRFKINTNHFTVHFDVSNIYKEDYARLGQSIKDGILVLYKHPDKDVWTNIKTFKKSGTGINLSQSVQNNIFYEVMIYAPLLSTLTNLEIECDDNCEIIPMNMSDEKSILVMGGQKSFGMGCTTVGTMFSNIIGRKCNANINNISFLEENYLEKLNNYLETNRIETSYALGIIELDFFNNKSNEYLKNILKIINMHCQHIIGWYAFPDTYKNKKNNISEALSDEINNKNIIIKDISPIFNENGDMCTYDDEYINDAGNILIYKQMISDIMEVI